MGADINQVNAQKQTALSKAYEEGNMTVLQLLLKRGASPNVESQANRFLLERTCADGQYKASSLLVSHGANRNIRNSLTPLLAAIRVGSLEMARLLLSEPVFTHNLQSPFANPNLRAVKGVEITPLVLSIEMLFKMISSANFVQPIDRENKIIDSVQYKIFRELVQAGADVNGKSKKITGIAEVIAVGDEDTSPLLVATKHNSIEIVRDLLDAGARAKGVSGLHPVTLCCVNKSVDVLKEFLSRGAKVPKEVKDKFDKYTKIVQTVLTEYMPVTKTRKRSSSWRPFAPKLDAGSPASVKRLTRQVSALDLNGSFCLRIDKFNCSDTIKEVVLRESGIVFGTQLLFKGSRDFPGSMCRLAKAMNISIQGISIVKKDDVYDEASTRDDKAKSIVKKLLQAIHKALGDTLPEQVLDEKASLMSKMDGIDAVEIQTLDIYTNNVLNPQNLDMIALRLIAKEAALIAIMPVQVQVHKYSKNQSGIVLRPFMRDQWSEINIERTLEGFQAIGKTPMSIGASTDENETPTKPIATVDITATLDVHQVTGKITVTIQRSNLQFMQNVPIMIRAHVYSALDTPIF